MRTPENLAEILDLEAIEVNLFRGVSPNDGFPRIFGGLVIAQALMAAYKTVPERICHSLHAYFIRPGDVNAPVLYEVERARDGGTFTTRRVAAIQHGEQIFNLACSFQTHDDGVEHQLDMPGTAPPEGLRNDYQRRLALSDRLPERLRDKVLMPHGMEFRAVDDDDLLAPAPQPGERSIWMRTIAPLPDDPVLHRALLAYASDHGLLLTALRPHGLSYLGNGVRLASIDHAMWFHRDFRMDDWLLYRIDSPNANGARALCRGSVFTRDGTLVASTAQEGMVRVRQPKATP